MMQEQVGFRAACDLQNQRLMIVGRVSTIQHLEAAGVDLYLDQQNIDTTTPIGRLLFQVTGAFAEFERAMIKQRVQVGLNRNQGQDRQGRQVRDQGRDCPQAPWPAWRRAASARAGQAAAGWRQGHR